MNNELKASHLSVHRSSFRVHRFFPCCQSRRDARRCARAVPHAQTLEARWQGRWTAESGGEAMEVRADVTREAHARRAVEEAVEKFGGLDVLVNAAGIISNGTIESTPLSDWDA